MNNWIVLMIIDAFVISFSEVFKKKALKKNSTLEITAFFTGIAFIVNIFFSKDAFGIDYSYLPIILLKSIIIVVTWIIGIKAIKELQLSIYGIIKVSRIVFTTILSCMFLGETFSITTLIGMMIVIIGLILVNITNKNDEIKRKNSIKIVILFLISCLGSAISAIIDKKILMHVTTSQLQFWFYFFLTIFFFIILFFRERKIDIKTVKNNYYIILIAICLVISDRILFIVNVNPSSKVIMMTILKQLSIVISIILGKLFFKEKEIITKIFYSILIIIGVVIMIAF